MDTFLLSLGLNAVLMHSFVAKCIKAADCDKLRQNTGSSDTPSKQKLPKLVVRGKQPVSN